MADRPRVQDKLGARLYHVTATENLPTIAALGLLPASDLARTAGLDPDQLLLRSERTRFQVKSNPVTLNHQKPLRAGRASADQWLDDRQTARDWARQLDDRVFLWPATDATAFRDSIAADVPVTVCSLSTKDVLQRLPGAVWASPINSGNARRRPSQRGNWLYVDVGEDWESFAENRRARGLVRTRDRIVEISLTRGLSPTDLAECDWRAE